MGVKSLGGGDMTEKKYKKTYDNGGAVAHRGFNYQHAVISLIAIRNFDKPGFKMYMEAEEDFTVHYDNKNVYIQVKGEQRLSFKTLLTKKYIEKNLSSGENEDFYKIVVYNISKKDLKEMQEHQREEKLFEKSYSFSESQRKQINDPKSDNLVLVITSFENNKIEADKYLIGELVQKDVPVGASKADLILNALNAMIEEKSEKSIETDADKLLKELSTDDLLPLFQKSAALERFTNILNKFNFTEIKQAKIQSEKNKIALEYSSHRKAVKHFLSNHADLDNKAEVDIIHEALESETLRNLDENLRYAICISAYCDIVEEIEL